MEAKTFWSYQDNFDFRQDIDTDSPFYVSVEKHRGEYDRGELLREFNIVNETMLRPGRQLRKTCFVLFGGHVGSGKSTELRYFAKVLANKYTVRHLELTKILDINNLRYSDLVIAQGQSLVQAFEDLSLQPEKTFVNPVVDWFESRIQTHINFKDIDAEVKTEAKAEVGFPFIAKFLALFTAKLKTGVTYKDELRREVSSGFTQLSHALNSLTTHANELLEKQGKGPLLFIIDGTDKMTQEDSKSFFEGDINQLWNIQTNVIVCAPISVLLEQSVAAMRFDKTMRLPMLKICERDGTLIQETEDILVELVKRRIPLNYFDDESTLRHLVQSSGGHPRDLLRLIRTCYLKTDDPMISRKVADKAIKEIATNYQRAIEKDDWQELISIDLSRGKDTIKTPSRMRLLYSMLLLEYNNYWWRTHPLVRSLPSYQRALEAFQAKPAAAAGAVS